MQKKRIKHSTVHGKLMVFFMEHEFKHPHKNPINSDTMKNGFSIHGFFIIIKKPWKKNMVGFILFHGIFMGHEALNIKGIFMLFLWDTHAIFMVFFPWKTHENSPLKSPEKPMKNMWIYHEKFHWIFMSFNFIV